jgi:serine phosphatase RsbU (regulator of sigma subunit)
MFIFSAYSQDRGRTIDSLKSEIAKHPNLDTNKINSLISLAQEVEETDPEQHRLLLEEAYRQSKVGQHSRQITIVGQLLGNVCFYSGEYAKAEEYLNESVQVARENELPRLLIKALSDLGQIEDLLEKDELALEHTLEAIKISEEEEDYYMLMVCYNNLAAFYYFRDLYEDALEYYMEAKNILLSHIDVSVEYGAWAIIETNIGLCYYNTDDLKGSIDQLKRAVEIHTKYDYYSPNSGSSRATLGELYLEAEEYDLAELHAKDALDISQEVNYLNGMMMSYKLRGEIEIEKKNYLDAIKHYKQAAVYSDSLGDLWSLCKHTQRIAECYKNMGNYQLAYDYVLIAHEFNDSLKKIQSDAAFEDAMTKYDTEKKEAENALLQKEAELKDVQIDQERLEAESERERNFVIGGSIGLILIVGLFFVINRNRLKTRVNRQLEQQRDEISEQKKEITDSIEYAKRIQEAILPPERLIIENLPNSFVLYKPKDIVAGDFYWLEKHDDTIFLAAADCTGHGVPGAMVSVVCHAALNRSVREFSLREPGEILNKTRELVIRTFEMSEQDVQDGMDIALCSIKNNKICYSGAHNALWIIRKGAEEIEEIKANKQPVGKFQRMESFVTHVVEANLGDTIYMFSDGYSDQFGGEKGKKFKSKNFKKLLLSIQNKTMLEQHQYVGEVFENWRGSIEQIDDVVVVGVRF